LGSRKKWKNDNGNGLALTKLRFVEYAVKLEQRVGWFLDSASSISDFNNQAIAIQAGHVIEFDIKDAIARGGSMFGWTTGIAGIAIQWTPIWRDFGKTDHNLCAEQCKPSVWFALKGEHGYRRYERCCVWSSNRRF